MNIATHDARLYARIALRAYALHELRPWASGLDNWVEAERREAAEHAPKAPSPTEAVAAETPPKRGRRGGKSPPRVGRASA